jgi:alcohol dehydrogenase class IV
VASQAGAAAFQRGLGGMHALAHSLGAVYGTHHGLLNAILMPYILMANRCAIEADAAYLARCLGLEGFEGLLDWILGLRREVGIPHDLAAAGIDSGERERIGAMAVADPSAGGNPIAFSAEEYAKLFAHAVEGTLPEPFAVRSE